MVGVRTMAELARLLSWKVEAKEPPKWGRKTTKEEKEEQKKEKHTPGKKKKRGRTKIKFDPGEYAGRSKPGTAEEKGKRCGKSYIAKEDVCHVGEQKPPKKGEKKDVKAPKRPRTRKVKPPESKPKRAQLPPVPELREEKEKKPRFVNSPEGGKGELVRDGYLDNGQDGIYAMQDSKLPHRIYFPRVTDQAQAQYVSSGIADLMGLTSPEDYLFRNSPSRRIGAGHEMQPFVDLDAWRLKKMAQTDPDVAGYFVHSVLTRHEGVIGEDFDNMVLRRDGKLMVLHFGGTLLWTEQGKRRTDGMSPDKLTECQTLRSPELNWQAASVFGSLSDEAIEAAVAKYLEPVEEKDILDLVDAARFSPEDRAEIGKGLIARKRLLENGSGGNDGNV